MEQPSCVARDKVQGLSTYSLHGCYPSFLVLMKDPPELGHTLDLSLRNFIP